MKSSRRQHIAPCSEMSRFGNAQQSARGLAHSKTLRDCYTQGQRASVLECGGPPPLLFGRDGFESSIVPSCATNAGNAIWRLKVGRFFEIGGGRFHLENGLFWLVLKQRFLFLASFF